MKTINKENQKEALQNALLSLNVKGICLFEHISQDKRKQVPKFFLQIGKNTISPALNYNDLNLFILGMSRAKQLISK